MSTIIRKMVSLPDFAPKARTRGMSDDIANLGTGENAVFAQNHNILKATCKRVKASLVEAHVSSVYFAVWPCTSDGTPEQTGKKFGIVARLTQDQRDNLESQRPGSTI